MKKIIFFLTLILWFWFSSVFFQAAFAWWIILSPPKFEFNSDPWEKISGIVKITNNSDAKMFLQSDVKDFIAWWETWQPSFIDPDENNSWISLWNWITVNNWEVVEVEIWEKKEIPFVVNIPLDSEPWGHYWSIFFFEQAWDWQIAVVRKIWSLILVKVSWEIREEWKIEDFNVWTIEKEEFNNNFLFTSYPVDFSLRYKNTWNIHLKPDWKITISWLFWSNLKNIWIKSLLSEKWVEVWKEIVDYIPVNDRRWNILADSIRKFEMSYNWEAFWYTEEEWWKTVKFKSEELGWFISSVFDKIKNTWFYNIQLNLNWPKWEEVVETWTFLFFPFKEIFWLLFSIMLIWFWWFRYRKYSKEKFEKELQARLESMKNS